MNIYWSCEFRKKKWCGPFCRVNQKPPFTLTVPFVPESRLFFRLLFVSVSLYYKKNKYTQINKSIIFINFIKSYLKLF